MLITPLHAFWLFRRRHALWLYSSHLRLRYPPIAGFAATGFIGLLEIAPFSGGKEKIGHFI